jgi:Fe/S biogenesis protein NfuA
MIRITELAREKIDSLVEDAVVQDPALRIEAAEQATPLQDNYAISLVEREDRQKTEIAVNVDGIRIFLNLDTSNLLAGAVIDWKEANGASGFQVTDPNQRNATAAARTGSPVSGELAERVHEVIQDSINPRIAAHGGAVELVDVGEDNSIYVRMGGGCQGCAASAATLRMGIERMVREAIPEVGEIIDVTDHTAGANPYY